MVVRATACLSLHCISEGQDKFELINYSLSGGDLNRCKYSQLQSVTYKPINFSLLITANGT